MSDLFDTSLKKLIANKEAIKNWKELGISPGDPFFYKTVAEGLNYGHVNMFCGGCITAMYNFLHDFLKERNEI